MAIQTVKQPMKKSEEFDGSVVGKCCYSLATVTRALLRFNTKLALVYLIFTGLCNRLEQLHVHSVADLAF